MKVSIISLCLQISICLLLAGAVYGADQMPIDSTTKAEQRARSVFRLLGWPDTGELRVRPPAANSIGRDRRWHVKIGNYAVSFDIDTGVLVSAQRSGLLKGRTQAVINIDEKKANQKAQQYLTEIGIDILNAKIITSRPQKRSSNPGDTWWEIYLHRYHEGYVFYRDYIYVELDPIDGSLKSFGYNFDSPLPDSTNVQITEEQAVQFASAYFEKLGYKAGKLISIELKIAIPDNYWDVVVKKDNPEVYKRQDTSRLAWIIRIDAPWNLTEIWVDSGNGEILGGVKSRAFLIKEGDKAT